MKRLTLIALLFLFALPALALAGGVEITSAPADVSIGATYDGAVLHIEGRVPADAQVVLRVTGAPADAAMKQKGKALGLLWMNMNTLHFKKVPGVCLVDASAPLNTLGAAGADLGLDGVARSIAIEPASADRAALMPELLKLKRHEGLYRESSGGVVLGAEEGGMRPFKAAIALPSRLAPGQYGIEAVAVKDGVAASRSERTLEAKLSGMPSFIADLAFSHGLWYGVLSSLIAIIAGLGIGLVFQSKGAH
jgi:uncharacterized protein (TIGR02186 family)